MVRILTRRPWVRDRVRVRVRVRDRVRDRVRAGLSGIRFLSLRVNSCAD